MENREIKRLIKAYNKRFKALLKEAPNKDSAGILLFIEHLKCRRDLLLLASSKDKQETKPCEYQIILFDTVVAEFEASISSTYENFHWNNFCELLRQNKEELTKLHDSI